MPTYEYACTNCGHTFEAMQRMSDKPLTRCPKCKGAIRRVIHGGMGVIFKGSGFYTTDYKKSSAMTGGNGGSAKETSAKDASSKESSSSSSSEKTKESSKESPKDGAKEKAKAST
ncbi:MAG TPA: FmdB family zinc ribbon protein [Spirochaetia bacterium]|nr:FmdB family zinc ribbon protein [Spirochaetia bacterium]